MEPILTLTLFTPAEAAAITGLSPEMQRDWRRHGYLPTSSGHARFDAFDLARMLAMKLLADRGIGPKNSAPLADIVAQGIAHEAFLRIDAWEGEHASIEVPQSIVEIGDPNDALLQNLGIEIGSADRPVPFWRFKAGKLMRQLWRSKALPLLVPGKCFIWWANGEHVFAQSVDKAIEELSLFDNKTSGPFIVLRFDGVCEVLLERAGRALCHVSVD